MNRTTDNQTLPSRPKHCRKTFATQTLRLINSRLQYYRRILQQSINEENDDKRGQREQGTRQRRQSTERVYTSRMSQRQQIQQKYNRDMKVRQLLNRAVRHLYDN